MATAPTYCTHRQLKDVFPQVNSFDTKRPIYGWIHDATLDNIADAYSRIYFSYNTGLVTALFRDGLKMLDLSSNLTTQTTKTNGATDPSAGAIVVDDGSGIAADDILKIGDAWYVRCTSKLDSNTITIVSADAYLFDSQQMILADDTPVYLVVDESTYDNQESNWFFYDSKIDLLGATSAGLSDDTADSSLNDALMEAGEDFDTLVTRVLGNASRYLDAKLDPNLPKEQLKDKEGNFDYIIVRTTALIAATFLIRAHDPTSEVANALMEDAQGNIDALNKGAASLSWQTTGDSSKGIIRDVSYTSGSVRPVDTRGRWTGTFDLIRVKIETGGALDGTATYSVWVKDGDKLGNQQGSQVVTSEKINGDYQSLAGGLQIRFGGSSKTSVATATNEWEVEVAGWQEEVDNSVINTVRMTRR